MVIIRARGSNLQPPRKILLQAAAYDTVRKRTVFPLQEMKREFIMMVKQKKVKLANEDTTTRRNPDSTSGIYLVAVKVAKFRQVADNRREKGEAKKGNIKEDKQRKYSSPAQSI